MPFTRDTFVAGVARILGLAVAALVGCGGETAVDSGLTPPDAASDSGPVLAYGELGVRIRPATNRALMNAYFIQGPNRDVALDSSGGCTLFTYPLTATYMNAGPVVLNMGAMDYPLNWNAIDESYDFMFIDLASMPGAVVSGMAIGADVPAFSGTATMPPTLLGVVLPPEGTIVARSSPFTVSWTPTAGAGPLSISLSSLGPQRFLRCEVPDEPGAFTVPASLMAQMPEVQTTVFVGRYVKERVDAPILDVYVTAASYWETTIYLVP